MFYSIVLVSSAHEIAKTLKPLSDVGQEDSEVSKQRCQVHEDDAPKHNGEHGDTKVADTRCTLSRVIRTRLLCCRCCQVVLIDLNKEDHKECLF